MAGGVHARGMYMIGMACMAGGVHGRGHAWLGRGSCVTEGGMHAGPLWAE